MDTTGLLIGKRNPKKDLVRVRVHIFGDLAMLPAAVHPHAVEVVVSRRSPLIGCGRKGGGHGCGGCTKRTSVSTLLRCAISALDEDNILKAWR